MSCVFSGRVKVGLVIFDVFTLSEVVCTGFGTSFLHVVPLSVVRTAAFCIVNTKRKTTPDGPIKIKKIHLIMTVDRLIAVNMESRSMTIQGIPRIGRRIHAAIRGRFIAGKSDFLSFPDFLMENCITLTMAIKIPIELSIMIAIIGPINDQM